MKPLLIFSIAWRQILSRSNSGFVRTISLLSISGIAIGVAALVILNSFMDGFSGTIMEHLAAVQPPLEVRTPGGIAISPEDMAFVAELGASVAGITEVSPVLEKTVVAAGNSGDVAGIRIRGVDWSVEPYIVSSSRLEGIPIQDRGAVMGHSLAARLGVLPGDTIRLASTDATGFSSMGTLLVDTIIPVPVAAVIDFGIDEYNSSLVLSDLSTASLLFDYPIIATSLSVGLDSGFDPVPVASEMTQLLRDSYISGKCGYMVCDAFISRHTNLFAALGLEKIGMTIVLALIGVVALLNLLSALNMIALEHRKDMGILRAMGASPSQVILTGLTQGGIIGAAGAAAGSIFALLSIFLINNVLPVKLESSVYWIDFLPGKVQPALILFIGCVTVIACFVASVIPSIYSLKVSPSQAVRYE